MILPRILLLLFSFGLAAGDAEKDFEEGLKAFAAKDYARALSKFEFALISDPDNIRYASEYRQAVIQLKQYDRCLSVFEKLVAEHPEAANAYLNYGFAYVDKIPDAGAITQVILANKALGLFSKSLELRRSWIAYYTRGNSYLYWPRIFYRTHLGVADLEIAMKMQKSEKKRGYHVRTFISLGDGYWKMDQLEKATQIWREGVDLFPDDETLQTRLSKDGDELKALIDGVYDPTRRVATDLRELWLDQ